MSGRSCSGGGAVTLEHYLIVHRAFNPPYLRRNLKQVISHLNAPNPPTMGSTASVLLSPNREQLPDEEQSEEEEDGRPAKRQRIRASDDNESGPPNNQPAQRQLFRQMTNGQVSKSKGVNPAEFYGRARPPAPNPAIFSRGLSSLAKEPSNKTRIKILPQDALAFRPALRIDLLGINPVREESWLPSTGKRIMVEIKCRCTIAVFCETSDNDLEKPDSVQVCRKVQASVLRVAFDGDNIVRECIFAEPYIFSPYDFMVNRKARQSRASINQGNQESQHYFGVGDAYSFKVSLEPVGYQKEWPSLDIFSSVYNARKPDAEALATQCLVAANPPLHNLRLACTFDVNFKHSPGPKFAKLHTVYRAMVYPLSFEMKADIRWSLPNQPSSSMASRPIKFDPTVSLRPVALEVMPTSAEGGRNTTELDASSESPGDGRAQRRRNNVTTYNLKTLSAQAQGKSPRSRKMRDLRLERKNSTRASSEQMLPEILDGYIVTYAFESDHPREHSVRKQTVVENLTCLFCMCQYRALDALRLHLHNDHGNFKFSLDHSNQRGATILIEFARGRSPAGDHERERTFQLGKSKGLFSLEKYLRGDESWIRAREGPEHKLFSNRLPHLQHLNRPLVSSSSASPHESRHSSPNTSNGPDDIELDNVEPEVLKPERPRKIVLVPKTSKPLFDGVTKRVLQPGEEVPDSDDEKDENWLHHKQRDVIMDYEDLTDDEKDYLIQWNKFIMEERLTCEKFLPESCIKFARTFTKDGWFAQRRSRNREFGIHLENFIMRGFIEGNHFRVCMRILRKSAEAEKARINEDVNMADVVKEPNPPKQRGVLGCECDKFTQPTDRVICTGLKCPGRFFHHECARKQGRPISGAWKCDACIN